MGPVHRALSLVAEPPDSPESSSGAPDAAQPAREPTARDIAAFRAHFESHFEALARYAYRYVESVDEAEDVVHDVFLRVWELRDSLDLHRDLRSYLYTLARNHAVDWLRRRRTRSRYLPPEPPELSSSGPAEAEERVAASELAAGIQRAVDALPERQRAVIALRWHQQASYDDIATALGISPKTVSIHLGRALKRLRVALRPLLE
jgi:RNA polymerase sigma-70 factor (family 1)